MQDAFEDIRMCELSYVFIEGVDRRVEVCLNKPTNSTYPCRIRTLYQLYTYLNIAKIYPMRSMLSMLKILKLIKCSWVAPRVIYKKMHCSCFLVPKADPSF